MSAGLSIEEELASLEAAASKTPKAARSKRAESASAGSAHSHKKGFKTLFKHFHLPHIEHHLHLPHLDHHLHHLHHAPPPSTIDENGDGVAVGNGNDFLSVQYEGRSQGHGHGLCITTRDRAHSIHTPSPMSSTSRITSPLPSPGLIHPSYPPLSLPISLHRPTDQPDPDPHPRLHRSASQQTFSTISSSRSAAGMSNSSSPPGPKTPTLSEHSTTRGNCPSMSVVRQACSAKLRTMENAEVDFGAAIEAGLLGSMVSSGGRADDIEEESRHLSTPHSSIFDGPHPPLPSPLPSSITPQPVTIHRGLPRHRYEDDEEDLDDVQDTFAPVRIKVAGRHHPDTGGQMRARSQSSLGSGSGSGVFSTFGTSQSEKDRDDRSSIRSSKTSHYRLAIQAAGPRTVVLFLKDHGPAAKTLLERLANIPLHRLDEAQVRVIVIGAGEVRPLQRLRSSIKTNFPFAMYADPTSTLFSLFSLTANHKTSSTTSLGLHDDAENAERHTHAHKSHRSHYFPHFSVKALGGHHEDKSTPGEFVLQHTRMGPRCIYASRHPPNASSHAPMPIDWEHSIETLFYAAGVATVKTATSVADELMMA